MEGRAFEEGMSPGCLRWDLSDLRTVQQLWVDVIRGRLDHLISKLRMPGEVLSLIHH
jgi:hypothetical protein